MKKLLFIIFTFLISNNAYSQIIEFNKCYASQFYKSFSEEKLKKRYFTIDTTNGLITRVEIEQNGEKRISPSAKINYIDKETVRGEHTQEDDILIQTNEFIINLNDYSVIRNYYLSGKWEGAPQREKQDPYLYQCESSSGGSSGLLDYWWAVILIIAITFFIFTQSGKRLKQIRRK